MKGKSIAKLIAVLALTGLFGFVAVFGLNLGFYNIKPLGEIIKYGLDIEGGVVVVYEAKTDLKDAELRTALDQTKGIIEKRINALGLVEPVVTVSGTNRIRVELPGMKDAQQAFDLIGKTAKLEFILVDPKVSMAAEGMNKSQFKGTTILTGKEVKNSGLSQDDTGNVAVSLEFNDEGKKLFADATEKSSKMEDPYNPTSKGGYIAILLDEVVISAPKASTAIRDGKAVISGNFTVDEATNLSKLIRGGALPVTLQEVQSSIIGPTLGLNALNRALEAAKIGIVLVMAFMILYYRYQGLVSALALVIYSLLLVGVLALMQATITLPGIAGILLSVGIAADANVIVFEKIKEELRSEKSIRASIDAGYARAFVTIAEANSTTLVACAVLYGLGEGAIRGFAITLAIGIVCSMITSLIVSKFIMKTVNSAGLFENPKFYGVRRSQDGAQ